jgi:CubicO group peptidase (beta-lactamase class C family)
VRLATAYSAEIVCSNVFVAHRDIDAILQTDLLALGHPVFKRVKIDVDLERGRVRARYLGLFAQEGAQDEQGRGCTHIASGEVSQGHAEPPSPPPQRARTDALWPEGEKPLLSSNPRLLAAVNDPVLQGPGMRAVVVVRDGRIIAETYGQDFTASTPLQGWSMTKSVTATLVGMAIRDGTLSLDQQHLFPQWEQDTRANISVADVMAMSGGLKWNEEEGTVSDQARLVYLARDTVAYARDRPLATPPGASFNYSSGQSVLLIRLWQNAVGARALLYTRERLFEPRNEQRCVRDG